MDKFEFIYEHPEPQQRVPTIEDILQWQLDRAWLRNRYGRRTAIVVDFS